MSDQHAEYIGPFDKEAERTLIAIVMITPYEMLEDIADYLLPEDFFVDPHKWVWSAIISLYQRRAPIDFDNISVVLGTRKQYDELGGAVGLDNIITLQEMGKMGHGAYYLRRIKEMSLRRQMIAAGALIGTVAANEKDLDKAIAQAQDATAALVDKRVAHDDTTVGAEVVAKEVLDEVLQWAADPQEIRGLVSGLYPFDKAIGGLEEALLLLLAARPGMGKSSLLDQVARGYAQHGSGILIFSLEMSRKSVFRRMACQMAMVSNEAVKRGQLNKQENERLHAALETLKTLPILIEQRGGLTVAEMESVIRRHSRNQQIDIVMVDTINRVRGEGKSQYERITTISGALADLAHNNHFSVICATQLNRANTQSADKRPTLADLRDSGSLEQDADIVCTLHRPWYYDKSKPETKNDAELDVPKNRDGESGYRWELSWDGPSMSFDRMPDKTSVDLDRYIPGRHDNREDLP